MLGEYKCNGYANDSAGVLQKLDSVFGVGEELQSGVKSQCIPVNITSKGELGRYAKVMSDEKWEQLIRHTTKMAADFGQRIMEGKINVQPYFLKQETGCDYCGLQSICGMERAEFADQCLELEEKKEEEIWEALREETAQEGEGI